MSVPHKCPICDGRGELKKKHAQTLAIPISKKPLLFTRHGCLGTGIVWEFILDVLPNPTPPAPPYPFIPTVPQWETTSTFDYKSIVTDHICSSLRNPPALCDYCFQKRRYHGAKCSCSPEGMPHSEKCKGYSLGAFSYEQLELTAQK